MGLRGPKRTPTKLLRLRGSPLAKKRADPPAPPGRPPVPSYLSSEERRVFRRVVDHLERMGILASTDGEMLGRYAVFYVLWSRVNQIIQVEGETYTTKDRAGFVTIQRRPESSFLLAYHAEMARIEASFGLTPASRAALGV